MDSFEALIASRFEGNVNALCWPRVLEGDFGEIVAALNAGHGITSVPDDRLLSLTLSAAGQRARDSILQDLEQLRAHELLPSLDCINGYHHDLNAGVVPTHVQSWHVDSATAEADTWLCTYFGTTSEGLGSQDTVRRVDVPETRAELLRLYGGADDEGFLDYLAEHFYDLHYLPREGAQPYSFGVGNLWRIACDWPGSPVPPCVHRAPPTLPHQPPRLLLIS